MSREIFTRKNTRPQKHLSLGITLNKKPVKGDVGIEIEIEGKKLPPPPNTWTVHQDNSLRGDEHLEYVLAKPLSFKDADKALDDLWDKFRNARTVFDDSNRTSVHVHLNCQEWFLNRLTAFVGLYFILEELLTEYCGEHRVGNLFCLRAKDATGIVESIKQFIKCDGGYKLPENLHYSGLNVQALNKYGSVEVRTLRGTSDLKVIKDWISILERLYNISAEFSDPREVCTSVSGSGPMMFFERILGDKADIIRKATGWSEGQIRESIYEGVRLAQDVCYCRDWGLYSPTKLKADPFGRSLKKVINKLSQNQGLPGPVQGYPLQPGYDEFEEADDVDHYDNEDETDEEEMQNVQTPSAATVNYFASLASQDLASLSNTWSINVTN